MERSGEIKVEGMRETEDGCLCPVFTEENEVTEKFQGLCKTCPADPRYPHQNQTQHCYFSFVDYQRCARLLGKYPGCNHFLVCYQQLCPSDWQKKWFEHMEKDVFKDIYPSKPIIYPGDKPPCDLEEDEPPPEKEPC